MKEQSMVNNVLKILIEELAYSDSDQRALIYLLLGVRVAVLDGEYIVSPKILKEVLKEMLSKGMINRFQYQSFLKEALNSSKTTLLNKEDFSRPWQEWDTEEL